MTPTEAKSRTPATHRCWYTGLASSTVFHIAVIVALGLVLESGARRPREPAIETRWSTVDPVSELIVVDLENTSTEHSGEEATAAGSDSAASARTAIDRTLVDVAPDAAVSEVLPESDSNLAFGDFATSVDLPDLVSPVDGAGSTVGSADGSGAGAGFFNKQLDEKRIAFVVDCSGSMNKPHNSDAKTRLRRLKFELVRAIGGMTAESEFFIIFFNTDARPMPARSMVRATPDAQHRYLEWASRMRAIGQTDPRNALQFAFRLRPEIIYFLTDGRFDRRVEKAMLDISQSRVPIHTFAFGDRKAEPVMKAIAAANNGEYHFVP